MPSSAGRHGLGYRPTMAHVHEVDISALLSAAENVPPAEAISAVAEALHDALGARSAAFLIADAAGRTLVDHTNAGIRFELEGTTPGRAWREQRTVLDGDGLAYVPVTVRGDALGVLAVTLPGARPDAETGEDGALDPATVRQLAAVAHALGYVLIANQRHTDTYETAMRSAEFTLAREIQRRLLPPGFVCEGGAFTIAGWLEPSASAAGDSFDYVASADRLTVSLTDATGHDLRAAMMATLTVNALRNARRAGAGLAEQAHAANEALLEQNRAGDGGGAYATGVLGSYVTGILLEVDIQGPDDPSRPADHTVARVINAGHPGALLLHDGRVTSIVPANNPMLGLREHSFLVQEIDLCPGDRLLLMTDGMLERSAAAFDLQSALLDTAGEHPRNVAHDIARIFLDTVGTEIKDDAAVLLLEWHGGPTRRLTDGGSDDAR